MENRQMNRDLKSARIQVESLLTHFVNKFKEEREREEKEEREKEEKEKEEKQKKEQKRKSIKTSKEKKPTSYSTSSSKSKVSKSVSPRILISHLDPKNKKKSLPEFNLSLGPLSHDDNFLSDDLTSSLSTSPNSNSSLGSSPTLSPSVKDNHEREIFNKLVEIKDNWSSLFKDSLSDQNKVFIIFFIIFLFFIFYFLFLLFLFKSLQVLYQLWLELVFMMETDSASKTLSFCYQFIKSKFSKNQFVNHFFL